MDPWEDNTEFSRPSCSIQHQPPLDPAMAPSDNDMSHQNIEVLDVLNIKSVQFVLPISCCSIYCLEPSHT